MIDDRSCIMRISSQEHLEDIEDWLEQRQIKTVVFQVVDVSSISLYHDVTLTVEFSSEDDAALFKLTWAR